MKHFRQILISYEIFLKTFHEPQKISYVLLSFFFFFYNLCNLVWEVMGVWVQNVHTSDQGDFEKSKKFFKISKIHSVMSEMLVKMIIEYFLMCFDPLAVVFFIMMGQEINTFVMNFLGDSLSVWLHFFRDSLHW